MRQQTVTGLTMYRQASQEMEFKIFPLVDWLHPLSIPFFPSESIGFITYTVSINTLTFNKYFWLPLLW